MAASQNPRRSTHQLNEKYGIVVSLKDTFGFLQPMTVGTPPTVEDQLYFNEREGYRGIEIGDEVIYFPKDTPKGVQASNLKLVNPESKSLSAGFRGTVFRDPEPHRSIPGLLQVCAEPPRYVAFMAEDCVVGPGAAAVTSTSSLSAGSVGKGASPRGSSIGRVCKGDEVECLLSLLEGAPVFVRAVQIKFLRSKRERIQAEELQRMLDAGAVREHGILDTVRASDGYGFIKPADRTSQIYFRFSDFVDQDVRVNEVCFICLAPLSPAYFLLLKFYIIYYIIYIVYFYSSFTPPPGDNAYPPPIQI